MNRKRTTGADGRKVIIIGAGEVGFLTASRLAEEGKQVVVIDLRSEALQHVQDALDVQTVVGSGASPRVLEDAGVRDAGIVLAVTDSDEVNIMACMFAKALAPDAVKLARIRNPEYSSYPDLLENALQINLLVNPEEEIVRAIDRLLTLPGAVEYNEFAERRIRMVGIRVNDGPLVDEPLVRFRANVQDEGVMVGAIIRKDTLIVPSGQDVILRGDVVYFVYRPESQPSLLKCVRRERQYLRTVCIFGGGNIGTRLAQRCEEKGIRVKLIEHNAARCVELADILNNTVVLHGDGTDRSLLEEERVGEMDAFAAVTSDEESNILSCLLAKTLGVGETVVRVNKSEYVPLVDAVGIDHLVSPRSAAVNSLLHYIRQGKVLASVSVGQDAAEAMEIMVSGESRMAGLTVKGLGLPRGVLLLAVVRGEEVFLPQGQTVIEAGDRVLLLAARRMIPDVERILTAQREDLQ